MIAVIQRVSEATVRVDGESVGACGHGLMILLGVAREDSETDVSLLASKIAKLRIFEDENGKMNRSILDVDGEALVISNFTLLADYRKGNRPDYFGSAEPKMARELYESFARALAEQVRRVECGIFGADMKVSLINDGPVTIVMDSKVLKK